MSFSPKIVPGLPNTVNRGACDWGWQNLVAYGCQQFVVVTDPTTLQIVQVLDRHQDSVSVVKWIPQNCHHDFVNSHMLCLASGDCKGTAIVWNVYRGETKFEFKEKNKGIKDLGWLSNRETGEIALLILYSGGILILWDCLTSAQLWKTSFLEQPTSINIDPFNNSNAVFLADECIILINDLQRKEAPNSQARKMSFSNTVQGVGMAANTTGLQTKRHSSSSLNKFLNMTSTLIGDSKPRRKSSSESEKVPEKCLHVAYHPRIRHMLIMLYPSNLQMVDFDISMVIGTIKLDNKSSKFVKVVPCLQKDVLFCLHENGCISIRLRREDTSHCSYTFDPVTPTPDAPMSQGSFNFGTNESTRNDVRNIVYDIYWQSDAMRLTTHSTIYGFSVNPITETNTCLVFNDSKVITWELVGIQASNVEVPSLKMRLCDLVQGLSRSDLKKDVISETKFLQTGLMKGVSSTISTVKFDSAETNSNEKISSLGQQCLAIGTENGKISLLDIDSGQIKKEFSIHTDKVRGIEWLDSNRLLSWAFIPSNNSSNKGENELLMLGTNSGKTEIYRQGKTSETAIQAVKLSPLKNYLVIAFRQNALEIWDFRNHSLFREIPTTFLLPNTILWSPVSRIRTETEKGKQIQHALEKTTPFSVDIQKMKTIEKEDCIIVDQQGNLCRITLEENRVSDIVITDIEGSKGPVTCMTMRTNFLLLGDTTGSLCHVDINKQTKNVPRYVERSFAGLKKVIMNPLSVDTRFAILYDNGIKLCSLSQNELKVIGQMKNIKDSRKVVDIEWLDAVLLSVVTQDGTIYITDLTNTSGPYPMDKRKFEDPIFCPHSLTVTGSLLMKYALQHLQTAEDIENVVQLKPNLKELETGILKQMHLIETDILEYLYKKKTGTGERCLIAASLFGDEFDLRFWTLALHCMKNRKDESCDSGDTIDILDNFVKSNNELLSMSGFIANEHPCCDSWCDVMMDHDCFWNQQLHRARLHDKNRTSIEHRYKCIDNYVLLNRLQDAVKLLLETDFESDGYREDYLRASLLSCDRNNTTGQSTMKLVATHLIINGKLEEGVSVLCLMDKVLDACKYLQSYNEWEKAAWLAKAVLSDAECTEIFTKWTEHLIQSKQLILAVFVMLSQRRFMDVAQTLSSIGFLDTAACFVEACKEHGIYIEDPLKDEILSNYGKHLDSLGSLLVSQQYLSK